MVQGQFSLGSGGVRYISSANTTPAAGPTSEGPPSATRTHESAAVCICGGFYEEESLGEEDRRDKALTGTGNGTGTMAPAKCIQILTQVLGSNSGRSGNDAPTATGRGGPKGVITAPGVVPVHWPPRLRQQLDCWSLPCTCETRGIHSAGCVLSISFFHVRECHISPLSVSTLYSWQSSLP